MRKYLTFAILMLAVAIIPVSCIGTSNSNTPAEKTENVDGFKPNSDIGRAIEGERRAFGPDSLKPRPRKDSLGRNLEPKRPGPKGPHKGPHKQDSMRQKRPAPPRE